MIKLYTFFLNKCKSEDVVYIFIMSETQEDLTKVKNEIIKNLERKFNNVSYIKGEQYANLTFYVIIIGLMMFFIYILLSNLYSILKLHSTLNEDSKRQSYRRSRSNILYTDNNSFYDDTSFTDKLNYNEYIVEKLNKQNTNVKNHFNELLEFKRRYNIDDTLNTGVSTDNLVDTYDNYDYSNTRMNTSFWDMLFAPPKHYELVNRLGGLEAIQN